MKRITLPNIRAALEAMRHEVDHRSGRCRARPAGGRAHAGGAMMQTRPAGHHRRRPGRADDGAAPGAACRCSCWPARRSATGASSAWAQGGVAACVGADDDPACHLADTLAAGDGLCDAAVAARILQAGPDTIAALARHGVAFDRAADGALALGLEAAHSRRRIVHAARRRHRRRDHARARSRRRGARPPSPSWKQAEAPPAGGARTTASRRAGGRAARRHAAAGQPRGAGQRRHRRALSAHHQPAAGPGARGCCSPPAPARRWPTWNSCSSTRPRWPPAPTRCRWSARRCAARAPS